MGWGGGGGGGGGSSPTVRSNDLAVGLRILANLFGAGLPVNRVLVTFQQLAPKGWIEKGGVDKIRNSVREGGTFANALATSGLDIPPVVIGTIKAGERTGNLAAAMQRCADITESAAATRAAIRSALAYPIILAVAGVMALTLLIGVVLPRFAKIIGDMGHGLPASTRALLRISSVAQASALPVFVLLIVAVITWQWWISTEKGRKEWHDMLLNLPVVGTIREAAGTSRTASALAALLETGVPATQAMQLAAQASGDSALGDRLLVARDSVATGQRMGKSIATVNAMSETATQLIVAGEESGTLASMLSHSAKIEGERAERLLKSAVRLLEPGLIIVFGGMVAFVAAALLQAVYTVRP